jgi:hypothetical protein
MMMTEVASVDLKLRRAVHVYEFMYSGILYVALMKKRPLGRVEGCVLDVGWRNAGAVQTELLEHVHLSKVCKTAGVRAIENVRGPEK